MLRYQPWKIAAILIGTLIAFLMIVPSLMPQHLRHHYARILPHWVPFRPIVLGLDLQGGAHMLLEIDTADLTRKSVEGLRDDVRRVVREQKIAISGGIATLERGVQVHIADGAE